MTIVESIRDLFAHMAWADALVCNAVAAAPSPVTDPRLCQCIHHLVTVQRAFLAVWQGSDLPDFTEGTPDAIRLGVQCHEFHTAVSTFIGGVREDVLDRPTVLPWAGALTQQLGRTPAVPRLGETALQVVLHSTYHRGQLNVRLRELGVAPPQTDYIRWLWLGRPAATWTTSSG